jgi:hypothetical protein
MNVTQSIGALTPAVHWGENKLFAKDAFTLLRVRDCETAPRTEPLILSTIHVAGFDLRAEPPVGVVLFAGYEIIPSCCGEARERRIVARFGMTASEARAFRDVLGGALREGY